MKFRVLLHGTNLEVLRDGEVYRLGFYATRYVDADGSESAKNAAIENIWQEEQIRLRINSASRPLLVDAEEVQVVKPEQGHATSGSGFTFYELDDTSDGGDSADTEEETPKATAYRIEKEAHG